MYCKDYTISFILDNKLIKRYIKFMTENEAQEVMQRETEKYQAKITDVSRFSQKYEVHYYLFLTKEKSASSK